MPESKPYNIYACNAEGCAINRPGTPGHFSADPDEEGPVSCPTCESENVELVESGVTYHVAEEA